MEAGNWTSIAGAFSGWRAILLSFLAGGVAVSVAGDVWSAPETASQAMALARENAGQVDDVAESVDRLERTVRIYICTRPELERGTRVRLQCWEFDQ